MRPRDGRGPGSDMTAPTPENKAKPTLHEFVMECILPLLISEPGMHNNLELGLGLGLGSRAGVTLVELYSGWLLAARWQGCSITMLALGGAPGCPAPALRLPAAISIINTKA